MEKEEILKQLKLIEFKFSGIIIKCTDMQKLKDYILDDLYDLIRKLEQEKFTE